MLTVAILNYNGKDTLRESIQSVLDQTLQPNRFVVIDNNSLDESWKIAKEMKVELIHADNQFKFITGLNAALALNQDWLFFMQNDVILEKECLEMMHSKCPSHNFMAQPVIYQPDGEIDNAGMDIFWPGYGLRRHKKWWEGRNFEPCGLVTTICFLIDQAALDPQRRFDERFAPAYYEDLSFFLDKDSQTQHVLIPSAKAIHKGNHTFSQTLTKKQISRICRMNRQKLIKKHYSGLNRVIRSTVSSVLDIAKETIDKVSGRRIFHD